VTSAERSWPTSIGVPPGEARFVFEPLGPQHNERDHVAWMTSIDHILGTAGWDEHSDWPMAMSLDMNMADLVRHAAEFEAGQAYAYSVLDPSVDDVVGCVYVNPDPSGPSGTAEVRSWVRVSHAELDVAVATAVADWLRDGGQFTSITWPGRPELTAPELTS
jgi:hypothetical protein